MAPGPLRSLDQPQALSSMTHAFDASPGNRPMRVQPFSAVVACTDTARCPSKVVWSTFQKGKANPPRHSVTLPASFRGLPDNGGERNHADGFLCLWCVQLSAIDPLLNIRGIY